MLARFRFLQAKQCMIESSSFLLFLAAALLIAVTPGPGIFYVAARTLAGGRSEGLASSFGTGLGGLVHVLAGAAGVSALVMASAEAFTALKLLGAVYLVWLGIKTIREARVAPPEGVQATGTRRAFREGVVVEALNPKTAAFFLAFIPQFIDPAGMVATQFVALGLISVALNTAADVVVAYGCARARSNLGGRAGWMRRIRAGSGLVMCGLGVSLLFARRSS
jgi:threonine/homoserine/homoserine lactone efflux protein